MVFIFGFFYFLLCIFIWCLQKCVGLYLFKASVFHRCCIINFSYFYKKINFSSLVFSWVKILKKKNCWLVKRFCFQNYLIYRTLVFIQEPNFEEFPILLVEVPQRTCDLTITTNRLKESCGCVISNFWYEESNLSAAFSCALILNKCSDPTSAGTWCSINEREY